MDVKDGKLIDAILQLYTHCYSNCINGFLVISSKRSLMKKRWLKRIVNITVIIAINLMTFAVVLFPDLKSVKTTGEYSYSFCMLELTDRSRTEDYKSDDSPRKLSVLVYYPDVAVLKVTPAH